MGPNEINGEWIVEIQQHVRYTRPADIVRGCVNSRDVDMADTECLGLEDQEMENPGGAVPSWTPIQVPCRMHLFDCFYTLLCTPHCIMGLLTPVKSEFLVFWKQIQYIQDAFTIFIYCNKPLKIDVERDSDR